MQPQQGQVEVAVEENLLGQKAPVDGPLEEELAAQVERPHHITHRVLPEERRAQQQLWGQCGNCYSRNRINSHNSRYFVLPIRYAI